MQKEILLVESSVTDAKLVYKYLNPLFKIKHVSTTTEALSELKLGHPSIILLDLPDSHQAENISLLRSAAPLVPIIVLTGLDQATLAIDSIKNGVDDFLLKTKLNAEVLERSINSAQEKKNAEVTTRKLQEQMDRFFGTALDMICVANTEGHFLRISPACEKILGFTQAEMCAVPFDSFIHPDDLAKTRVVRARLIGGETVRGFENRYRTRNGSYKTLSWISVIEGGVIYAVARDVSERNQFVSQLYQKERVASLGTLSAGIAHEINNPLAHAIINLDLLSSGLEKLTGDAKALAELNALAEQAKLGTSRVRDIVQSLKIFSSKEEEKIAPVDLKNILESAIDLASHEISIRAQLVTDFTGALYAAGNESLLGQVFVNLLVNAAQSIPEGHSRENKISVRTGINADGRPFVAVTDTGVGMSDETKKQIFDPFYTTKPMGVGTGLGLSICHGIVTSLGGAIKVVSNIGEGSTFTVTLPSARATDPPPLRAPDNEIKSVKRKLKILIIDDEISFADALKTTIELEHAVQTEGSSVAALQMVLQNPDYDCIICDMMMPEMTGMDFYQNLVRDGRGLEKKIIFMSGGAFTPQTISFLENCQNLRLAKPFSRSEFRNHIANVSKNS